MWTALNTTQSHVEELVAAASRGDTNAAERLLPAMYDELHRLAEALMARESPDQTIQATGLIHEAYLRLVGSERTHWNDHQHFFRAAAMAMRRCLVDRARSRKSLKRGGDRKRIGFDAVIIPIEDHFRESELEDVDRLITMLADENARWADVINMRLFLGLTIEQTAQTLNISESTVKGDWRFAIAWLRTKIKHSRETA